MKTLALALLIAAAAMSAQSPMWARVYFDDVAVAERDIVGAGMDVVSGSLDGKYYDVVAPESELAGLQEMGYRVKILAADPDKPIRDLPPDMGLYHTYAEMVAELQSYAASYPNICKLSDIGDTWEGRDMWSLKISDNPAISENEQRLYVCGDHHAREIMTVEIPLYFIKSLLEGYGSNPNYQYYINNFEMYFVPMVNPDGHVYVEGHSSGSPSYWWRKNRRNNGGSYGVDLNRNYSYKWGYDNIGSSPTPSSDTYRGPSAFSEPETTAIRNLMIGTEFDYGIDYHSYGEYILIPYAYDTVANAPNPERTYFMNSATSMNQTLGSRYHLGTPLETLGYRVNGGSFDYTYGEIAEKPKCYMWSLEVNTSSQGGFGPADTLIAPTVAEQMGPFLWLLEHMRSRADIELASFQARPRGDRAVVTWETSRERNHAGFNLYRGERGGADGSRARINGDLITGRSPYSFEDDGVSPDGIYDYFLEDVDLNGRATTHGPAHLNMNRGAKAAFALAQNSPNPARGITTIKFSLPTAGDAKLAIYDLAGRRVSSIDLRARAAGANDVAINVSSLAAGVYVYRLEANGLSSARKMVVAE